MKPWGQLLWMSLLALCGCASPLTGLRCEDGYTRCGDQCVDLSTDVANCGGCGVMCRSSASMCVDGQCVLPDGGIEPDAGPDASDPDAGDGGPGEDGGDGGRDAGGPRPIPDAGKPRCDGTTEPEECICDIGELKCGNECVRAGSDPNHCGGCDVMCEPEQFCISGTCMDDCDEPLVRCGGLCIDVMSDAENCGQCGNVCTTKLCRDGVCTGAPLGHLVAIGHDYATSNAEQDKIPGIAATLNGNFRPSILGYFENSAPITVEHINTALQRSLGIDPEVDIERGFVEAMSFQLAAHDVLIVYPQDRITQADLETKVIGPLDGVLAGFLARGGVVILFEGAGRNRGTYQIAQAAGLVSFDGRVQVREGEIDRTPQGLIDFTHAVRTPYAVESRSFGFEGPSLDTPGVLMYSDADDLPVVVHNIYSE